MKDSIANHRAWLGLVVLALGLSTIGTWSPKASRAMMQKGNQVQSVAVSGPKPEKYVAKHMTFANEPIDVSSVTVRGKSLQVNSAIAEAADWLNGFSFKVKNISRKRIAYLSLELWFPETKSGGPIMGFPLRYGADPKLSNGSAEMKTLGQDEETEFTISSAEYGKLKAFIEQRMPIANINAVSIYVVIVVFDDDTAWATGSFMHRGTNGAWVDDKD